MFYNYIVHAIVHAILIFNCFVHIICHKKFLANVMHSKQITCKQFAIITGIQSNKFIAVNSLKSQFLQLKH